MTVTKLIDLGRRKIGPGHPCYLIAEVGTTCLGDLGLALQLVEASAAAGMDAVKFQVIDADQNSNPSAAYPVKWDGEERLVNMQEMFSRLTFSRDEWRKIKDACAARDVDFFATVDYVEGVDMLEEVGVSSHKLGAWDTTFKPLIDRIGETGKPMFVDLGPTSRREIEDLKAWYGKAGGTEIIFLHDYHTGDDREMNMAAIAHLAKTEHWPVGYSSPGHDHDLDFLALGLGAKVIEKRLTMDRSFKAFHSHESLEPSELATWVGRIRHAERAIGAEEVRPSANDRRESAQNYRSVCTMRQIRAGEVFTPVNLHGKRPGTGLPTVMLDEIWGKCAARDLSANTLIVEDDVV